MAIYDTAYIGTTGNRVTFNNFGGSPVYRVISRAPSRRQLRELDIPIPYESGISDFETLIGQMAYVIDGIMYPGSESEYDSGVQALRKVASLDYAQDDADSDNGYVPFAWTDASGTKQVFVKVLYVDIREDTRKGLVQPFRFICKIKDPTIHSGSLVTASTASVDPTTVSGDAEYSFTYPVIYGASTYTVSSNAINAGDLPAYPQTITINGPVGNPIVTNETTGEFIEVDETLATSSDKIIITYDKDSLSVELNGNSVLSSVSSDSTWFKLNSGGNDITLSGASIGSGSYVEVKFYSAWPLS